MIGIASDHGGFDLKQELISFLKQEGYNVLDYGTMVKESSDYPEYAFKVGEAIKNKGINFGIVICTTGIGMSIACNKVKGVRCAKVESIEEAKMTRLHNDSNVLALRCDNELAKEIVKVFLETKFSHEERHIRRINMITNYEDKNEY